jgi:hypothetical protein
MADAVITSNMGTMPLRAAAPVLTASVIPLTVTYSATAYATASGGLPFDLFAMLQQSSPTYANINYRDIIGLLPLGTTTEKFVVDGSSFAIGTATDTTLPCTIRIYGTGGAEKAAFTEVDNANLTGSFKALLLVARNGAN